MTKRQPRYEVYVYYDYAEKKHGDVISQHYTYLAANKKASECSMWGIRELCPVIKKIEGGIENG